MAEKTMIIFIGIQGAGKTTYYKQHLSDTCLHVSLDELHTRNKERLLIEDCIRNGRDFVVDNTNPTRSDRERYILPAKNADYRVIGYFFESKLKDCIARNDLREGKKRIDPKAIAATSNCLELPDLSEGFDELYFIAHKGDEMIRKKWRSEYDF